MKKLILALAVAVALVATPAVALDYTYDGGGTDTLDGGGALYGDIWVRDGAGGIPSTLIVENVITEEGHNSYVSPFDGSAMIINSGTFDGFVGGPYYYTFNGMPGAYDAYLEINGGDFHYRIKGDDGVLTTVINGGTFDNQYDTGSGTYMSASHLTINGGTFSTGVASEYRIGGGEITVNGGSFGSGVRISSGDNLVVNDGDFDGILYFIYGDQNSTATVTGGDFSNLEKWGSWQDFGEIHISGGDWSTGTASWTGDYEYVAPTYNFYGQDFEATLLGTEDDEMFGMVFGRTYYYQVSGTLCDGNTFLQYGSFYNDIENGQDVGAPIFNFHECAVDPDPIPEPTTVALLGLGALGLVGARRRRK
jgi:hypothetical protein